MKIKHPNKGKTITRKSEWTEPNPMPDTAQEVAVFEEDESNSLNGEFSDKRRKKNTKNLCKGKVGKEHNLAIRANKHWEDVGATCGLKTLRSVGNEVVNQRWFCIHEEYCTNCGKKVAKCLPMEKCPTVIN